MLLRSDANVEIVTADWENPKENLAQKDDAMKPTRRETDEIREPIIVLTRGGTADI